MTDYPKFVTCPDCGVDMSEGDDGWYCTNEDCDVDELAFGNVLGGFLSRLGAQKQWDERMQAERERLDEWIAWAGA